MSNPYLDEGAPPNAAPWRERLDAVVALMRDVSLYTDPQEMVMAYGARARAISRVDAFVAVSRRNLAAPRYRITRSTKFASNIDPWKNPELLPVHDSGLLGELLYAGEARLIGDFHPDPSDPAFEYLRGARSLAAIPQFDNGQVINMFFSLGTRPHHQDPERFPEVVWTAGLFGRTTQSLVLSRQLREALGALDREMKTIAEIQQALLPRATPLIPGLSIAAHYQTSRVAGGDYYDFFTLPDRRWGILIADVSGHGAPAAVIMAILHALAHTLPEQPTAPGSTLELLNARLSERYTSEFASFVTAFYAVYDAESRSLTFANAGHNPPLLRRASTGKVEFVESDADIPLGVLGATAYNEQCLRLEVGDTLMFYTDGITEAMNDDREQFGTDRLVKIMSEHRDAPGATLQILLDSLNDFTAGAAQSDDRTVLVARATPIEG
ncbi:MAG: PP2C family protein-serine/threonine phosphatase [Planctomycetota bacterium]|nr:PP2C family protein-serine/threonine phosphatase [Planctomycetota bacterium]